MVKPLSLVQVIDKDLEADLYDFDLARRCFARIYLGKCDCTFDSLGYSFDKYCLTIFNFQSPAPCLIAFASGREFLLRSESRLAAVRKRERTWYVQSLQLIQKNRNRFF